jgi:TRAP-type C4-dicarboxylate transport system permease small subunit
MDKKNTGIIATIIAVILCGCPGICLGIFAAITAAGVMPYTTTFNDTTNTGVVPASYGYVGLCVSVIFILIPVLIGIFTLRKKPEGEIPTPPVTPSEPMPPAI